jgi:hypothetical protein
VPIGRQVDAHAARAERLGHVAAVGPHLRVAEEARAGLGQILAALRERHVGAGLGARRGDGRRAERRRCASEPTKCATSQSCAVDAASR